MDPVIIKKSIVAEQTKLVLSRINLDSIHIEPLNVKDMRLQQEPERPLLGHDDEVRFDEVSQKESSSKSPIGRDEAP